ncbi:conserved Plasmodium protein, unknown function [Plasmodium ovale curtisi]|uniref:Uncharacterized protein n=1 Tax=Plasmodium ovale curtisi TaxID=864141 RepID=A0A1A8W0R6_PLAOA|nr:conserved Plasmodium protein, unknown function [Plasmodium ovale curtisi]
MNKNFTDKSNEYGKRLLSASITREMKENEERINLNKLPVDSLEKNDFIAYMELTLENLIISRYFKKKKKKKKKRRRKRKRKRKRRRRRRRRRIRRIRRNC